MIVGKAPRAAAALIAICLLAVSACSGTGQRQRAVPDTGTKVAPGGPAATGSARVVRTLVKDSNVVWGMVRLPDGDVLYTTRDTHTIRRIDPRTGTSHTLGTVTAAKSGGEGGLLGIAVAPDYSTTHVLHIYYSTATDNRIARIHYYTGRSAGHQLGAPHVIKSGIPHGPRHNGGQLRFGPDKLLYASTGEASNPPLAQSTKTLGGKILRMTRYGKSAPGNPTEGSSIWTLGHRNVQGMAWDPSGRMWASEFGDRKADELNLIKPGKNYGWPNAEGRTDNPKYTSPVAQWGTDVDSPSGVTYTLGAVWMAALNGERLWRIPINGSAAGKPTSYLTGRYGRLRGMLWIGGGRLLVSTSNTDGRGSPAGTDDRILELAVS